jgi:hypothetical protein
MPRNSLVMSLAKSGSNPEGIIINAAGNGWTSPPGGWLQVEKGVWTQNSGDLVLLDPASENQLAVCLGCVFEKTRKGEGGKARFPESGENGSWSVVSTTP